MLQFLKLDFVIEEILTKIKDEEITSQEGFDKIQEVLQKASHYTPLPVSEAIIRPTGLIDPIILIKPIANQVDDVLEEVRIRVQKGQRVLITTLTKKFAEELDLYFKQINVKSAYIHSDVETLERVEILSDLRRGVYDVLIGINLLREGLDLPEVSLVAIFDADKEGFLRSKTSLIQIIGRAARHFEGKVIMYADKITDSMKYAVEETDRRRKIQTEYNQKHGITPISTQRELATIVDDLEKEKEDNEEYGKAGAIYSSAFGFSEKDKDKVYQTDNKSIHGPEKVTKTRGKKAKQVYADFNSAKDRYLFELNEQNPNPKQLQTLLDKAIKDMDFEKAAAIRDYISGNQK